MLNAPTNVTVIVAVPRGEVLLIKSYPTIVANAAPETLALMINSLLTIVAAPPATVAVKLSLAPPVYVKAATVAVAAL